MGGWGGVFVVFVVWLGVGNGDGKVGDGREGKGREGK